jgi:hypothetical protein
MNKSQKNKFIKMYAKISKVDESHIRELLDHQLDSSKPEHSRILTCLEFYTQLLNIDKGSHPLTNEDREEFYQMHKEDRD